MKRRLIYIPDEDLYEERNMSNHDARHLGYKSYYYENDVTDEVYHEKRFIIQKEQKEKQLEGFKKLIEEN